MIVTLRLTRNATARLVVSPCVCFLTDPIYSDSVASVNRTVTLSVAGLTAGTTYYYGVELDGAPVIPVGQIRAPDTSASMTIAFAGDGASGSDAAIYDAIRGEAPDLFLHLGDLHYDDIGTSNPARYDGAFDAWLGLPRAKALAAAVPTLYLWDDHDYCGNDTDATSVSRDTACSAYRRRVPHAALVETGDTGAIYHTVEWTVGGRGVVLIVTDQRSRASVKGATDNASKSVLGTVQKAWFKGVLADPANAGKLFLWACSRVWGGIPTVGADHWGGFTTERRELADHIKANCLGRVLVLSADMHSLAIDDGSHHDFATGGGCPLPTFQAAPLDRTDATTYGGATYSDGRYTNNHQYGMMSLTATGTGFDVVWTGKRDTGAVLVTRSFSVAL